VGRGEDGCGGDRAVLVSPVEQTRKPKIGDRCLIAGAAQAQGRTHPVRISIKQHFLSYQTGRGDRCTVDFRQYNVRTGSVLLTDSETDSSPARSYASDHDHAPYGGAFSIRSVRCGHLRAFRFLLDFSRY
jgi:hypothetical protein